MGFFPSPNQNPENKSAHFGHYVQRLALVVGNGSVNYMLSVARESYIIYFGGNSGSLHEFAAIKRLPFLPIILAPLKALRGILMDSAEPTENIEDRMA